MKKALRYLFEVRFLPNISTFLFNNETWLRVLPLKRFFQIIDPQNAKRIIDIGGGTGRLELAINRTDVYIYDLNENSVNIAKQFFKNTIVGNGTKIDLENDSFDWAISIHTLEHIPKDERESFILEMIRISKEGIFLNFPEGEYAKKLCENFLYSLDKNGKELNSWTIEHLEMGLPKVDEIEEILKKQAKFTFKYAFIRNYYAEDFYWTKIKASNNIFQTYLLSPASSFYKVLKYKKQPSVELVLLGSRTEKTSTELLGMIMK